MSKKKHLHVVRNPDGGWALKREGAYRATSVHKTQKDAIKAGKATLRGSANGRSTVAGELIVHGRNGRIKDTYGRDSSTSNHLNR